jgi:putative membrane protein
MFRVVGSCIALAVLCSSFAGGVATAQQPALDKDFLLKAAPQCHALVQYAELAEKRSTNEAVKTFARKIVQEHKKLHEEVARAAKDQKLAIASGTERATRDELDRLGKLTGAAFDREFLNQVIQGHEKAIQICEAQAARGSDARIQRFAKDALPTLKEHLKEARKLADKVK